MTYDHYHQTSRPRQSDDYRRSLEMDRSRIIASLGCATNPNYITVLKNALGFIERQMRNSRHRQHASRRVDVAFAGGHSR